MKIGCRFVLILAGIGLTLVAGMSAEVLGIETE